MALKIKVFQFVDASSEKIEETVNHWLSSIHRTRGASVSSFRVTETAAEGEDGDGHSYITYTFLYSQE